MAYKLHYFNCRGRAEILRIMLVASGETWEDNRIEKEQWPEIKPTTPTGFLPYLETPTGCKLVQTSAIIRYLAKKFNLYGSTDCDFYKIERTLAQVHDVLDGLYKIYLSPEDKKAEMTKEFVSTKGKILIDQLAGFLNEKDNTGFFVGKTATVADFAVFMLVDTIRHNFTAMAEDVNKHFATHYDHFLETYPTVSKWMKERPETSI